MNTFPKLKISIGSDDFKDLVATDLFVDKSLFIKEIIDAPDKAILITRPRRWGKTLSMQMLKYFFAPDIDKNGVIKEKNTNKILFEGGEIENNGEIEKFKALKIAKLDDGAYLKHQGKWPVVFVSFKDALGDSYKEIIDKLCDKVSTLFIEHAYLAQSHLDKAERNKFQRIKLKTSTIDELEDSLRFLSYLLFKHYKKKVYILVDEYDKAFNSLLETSLNEKQHHDLRIKVAKLITNMLSACGKGNECVEKIILTGIFDTLKKEGNSGFNNVSVYGILHANFSSSFGFSEEEINEQLLSKFNLDSHTEKEIRSNIKNWYNGYSVPTYRNGNMQVYTPWAVMKYLNEFYKGNAEPESYWTRSGSSTILSNLLQAGVDENLQSKFIALAQGEKQVLHVDKGMSLFKSKLEDYKNIEKVFAYLLLNSGYLTAEKVGNQYIARVSNFEVKQEFESCIAEELEHNKRFIIADPIIEAFIKVDEEQIRELFTLYITQAFSHLDAPKSSSERSYQMFTMGLLHSMRKTHVITSEPESGQGRCDLTLTPILIDPSLHYKAEATGFVIELKRANKNDADISELAKEGLNQIKQKKYKTVLDKHECKNQVLLSIAFHGKKVEMEIEKHLTPTFSPDLEWQYAQKKMAKEI